MNFNKQKMEGRKTNERRDEFVGLWGKSYKKQGKRKERSTFCAASLDILSDFSSLMMRRASDTFLTRLESSMKSRTKKN